MTMTYSRKRRIIFNGEFNFCYARLWSPVPGGGGGLQGGRLEAEKLKWKPSYRNGGEFYSNWAGQPPGEAAVMDSQMGRRRRLPEDTR